MIIVAIHGLDGSETLIDIQVHGFHVRGALHGLDSQIGNRQTVFDLIGHLFTGSRDGSLSAFELRISHHEDHILIVPGIGQSVYIHFARKVQGPGSAGKIEVHFDVAVQSGIRIGFDIQLRAEDTFQCTFLFPGAGFRWDFFGILHIFTAVCGRYRCGFCRLQIVHCLTLGRPGIFRCQRCHTHHSKEQHDTHQHRNRTFQVSHNKLSILIILGGCLSGECFFISRYY